MTIDGLPLRLGATGDAVRDLQHRLIGAGFGSGSGSGFTLGTFDEATAEAVRRFQEQRGIVVDGVCGSDTWSALVEAGYRLGDRLLYLRRPMLRGDDVGDLQLRLGALGFDAGRVDAIFGPDTEKALKDFQRNTAITTDGVCGPDVIAALERLGAKANGPASVAGVRERERLDHAPKQLNGRRIAIGSLGGLDDLARLLAGRLRDAGADTCVVDHADDSEQAVAANDFRAELFLGVGVSPDTCRRAAYYQRPGFESVGGHQLATLVVQHLHDVADDDADSTVRLTVTGMRLGLLRETRMPAVVCHLAAADQSGERQRLLAERLAGAIVAWVETPAR